MVVNRLVARAQELDGDGDTRAAEGVIAWAVRLLHMPEGQERTRLANHLQQTLLDPRPTKWDAMAVLHRYELDRDMSY